LENEKNEDMKNEQTSTLERAQLLRKVSALENQLRFQTNLNDETKREIEKLDTEISQVADNCSNREQILQRKLEDTLECLRKERVLNAALKSEVM
jgi:peptidoglycan hydrolase CwlO-like protein